MKNLTLKEIKQICKDTDHCKKCMFYHIADQGDEDDFDRCGIEIGDQLPYDWDIED